ncbi:unnamed protein product [Rangifer tarandus platyrhynchus]|uniref:Uncharacterized protein n=2 Tax=Rangifer tarandus platyrhynchus TaxID=3082113 RepID=A0AC59ZPV9_RANTA|nr:unnamed protein product [Rangifer tarandus platyrhynchus]
MTADSVRVSFFQVASLCDAVCNKVCAFTGFLGMRSCFFLHVVCVDFVLQKWHMRFSRPGLAALAAVCSSWAKGRGEAVAHLPSVMSYSLWCPRSFPEEFEIRKSLAGLISQTGQDLTSCHPANPLA